MIGTFTKLKDGWYVKFFEDGTVIHTYLPLHPEDENLSYAVRDSAWEGKKVNFEVVVQEETSEHYAKLIPSKEQQKQLIKYEKEYKIYMNLFVNSNLTPPTIEQYVDKVNNDSDFASYWGPEGKEMQKRLITEIMDLDAKDGLYQDDVEKLAKESTDAFAKRYDKHLEIRQYAYGKGFTDGYNKAKETLYTEEQVREAIKKATTRKYNSHFYNADEIIQSLKQPKKD